MLTRAFEVVRYVKASAGRAGLNVVFEETNEPRHDGKTIYLPRITGSTTEKELLQLMASVDHEVSHDKYSSFKVLKDSKIVPKSMLFFTWNFIEDSRVNMIEATEYLGFQENWDVCNSSLVAEVLAKAAVAKSTFSKLAAALICWEARCSGHMFPLIESVVESYRPDERISDVLSHFSADLVHCQQILNKEAGTQACLDLAKRILDKLAIDDPKTVEELKASSAEGKDGDKPSSEEKASATEEKSSSKAVSDEKEAKPEHGEGEKTKTDEDYKVYEIEITEDDLNKFSLSKPEEVEMGKIGLNLKPVKSSGDWYVTSPENFVVVNYPKKIVSSNVTTPEKYFVESSYFKSSYKSRIKDGFVTEENFAQQVRKLIQIRAKVQRQYGVKKGKLDQARLSRICFNAPGLNERVFKNKIENKTLDAAISVLVDLSGSMSGDKMYYALASTVLLNEVCSTLQVPVEIVGFTDDCSMTTFEVVPSMHIFKSFNDRVSNDDIESYFGMVSCRMVGNPDGENILWAYDRLLKRKEKKRLLLVMSDGSPAATRGGYGLGKFTEKVIKEIEQARKVDLYGLGLLSDSVQYYYKASSVVNKVDEIPKKLLELIEKRIFNV